MFDPNLIFYIIKYSFLYIDPGVFHTTMVMLLGGLVGIGESVIIIMSDHGYRPSIDWENPSNEDYISGFNNLSAYYMPNQMDNIPETTSPVNIFRIIFNSYLDTEFEMLEDRQIWHTIERPFDFTDVTDKLPR